MIDYGTQKLAKALYEAFAEPPFTPWDTVVARLPPKDGRGDETPGLITRWLRTADAVPDIMRDVEGDLTVDLQHQCEANARMFERLQEQANVIRAHVEALRHIKHSDDPASNLIAEDALNLVRPYHYQDWTWICEYCYARIYSPSLPASWDMVLMSAACYDCRKRIALNGGVQEVKGGAYASIPDPRTYHQP